MLKLWRGKSRIVIACLLLLTMLAVGGWVMAECYTYSSSKIIYFGTEAYCGSTGSGCTECANDDGGSCVTNGDSCIPSAPETKR